MIIGTEKLERIEDSLEKKPCRVPNYGRRIEMGGIVLFFFYGNILFCIIACVVRIAKFAGAPLSLRWELYRGSPVYELTEW